ncbi:MAG: hypothetical protein VKK97_09455, partial [Synechococcaceae cyanobacterium]|nr:hypothetical protein [Synechococcaceae cyanobacterium]
MTSIFQAFEGNPSASASQDARLARQCLSQFWLQAPVDQLELLYGSAVGDCFRVLLGSGLSQQPLTREEQEWRSTLAERLGTTFERPETINVLLALMPYYAPGKMRVADPMRQLPGWLLPDYARLFETELLPKVWQPAALLAPVGKGYGPAPGLGLNRSPLAPEPQVVAPALHQLSL